MIGITNASISSASEAPQLLAGSQQVTLLSSAWTDAEQRTGAQAVTPPFTQTKTFTSTEYLAQLTDSSVPIVGMYLPATITTSSAVKSYEKEYGYVTKITTAGTAGSSNGSLTAYCYVKKPTQDIVLTVKGAR